MRGDIYTASKMPDKTIRLKQWPCSTMRVMPNTTVTIEECSPERYRDVLHKLESQLEMSVSFLQSATYAAVQTKTGKTVVQFVMLENQTPIGCGVAVTYDAPGGIRFLYLPYGPVLKKWDTSTYTLLEDFFRPIARRLGCSFVRVDSEILHDIPSVKSVSNKLAKTASLQPRSEWVLDISDQEEAVWMGFHKHARYNVRLAERADAEIRVRNAADTPLDDFYALMETTANRDGFGIFDREYYRAYLSSMDAKDGFTVMVRIDGKPAAAGLFVVHDGQAHYVFAGSSNEYRKIAPAYSVIWAAIREAKARGCTLFNFGGIVDDVKGQNLAGVTAFKQRFGGYRVVHQNPADIVYKQFRYSLFKLYKTLR